jgi:hypothetical protein
MYEVTYHAKGYSDETIRGFACAQTALRSAKLRLKNQADGSVVVRETDGGHEPVASATKKDWSWK